MQRVAQSGAARTQRITRRELRRDRRLSLLVRMLPLYSYLDRDEVEYDFFEL